MAVRRTSLKLRVGVLMGGMNIEREVSFNSGRTICDHLDTSRYEVIPLFQTESGTIYHLPWHFLHRGKIADFESRLTTEATLIRVDDLKTLVDFVYIAVHGRYGEDGVLQGMLEILQIPYLGTKVFGSALGMEKSFHKPMLQAAGVPVPPGFIIKGDNITTITEPDLFDQVQQASLTYPLIIKPSHEGSSFGITVVKEPEELMAAVYAAGTTDKRFYQDVLVEKKISGMEFVCVLLEQADGSWRTLPLTEVGLEAGSTIFDYDQKYMPGRAYKITPARCSAQDADTIKETCITVANTLNFKTIARIDGILADGVPYIIDPNTLTGMAPSTFLFHQAAEVGMGHGQLINYLIEQELRQYGLWESFFGETSMHYQKTNVHVTNKFRVGVLLGGNSNEREISLESGRNVCYKLSPEKYEITPIFVDDAMQLYALSQRLLIQNSTTLIKEQLTQDLLIAWADLPQKFDFMFIGLHGGNGENGTVQGMLEMLKIPYNGPGVLASALCMDKFKTNNFLALNGFAVPTSVLIDRQLWQMRSQEEQEQYLLNITATMPFPLIIKPHDDGCSMFVAKVKTIQELHENITKLFAANKNSALIEELIHGMELTVGVIGNGMQVNALPPSQAVTNADILSIEEKFLPGSGHNITPAPLSPTATKLVQETVTKAYQTIGCNGYSRIDCFYQDAATSSTGKERVVLLEFNTLPALTPATCLFHQAAEIGMKPMDFLDNLIQLGIQLHQHRELEVTEHVQNL